jgi:hypothetical protein
MTASTGGAAEVRSTWTRDLSEHVDRFGKIAVSVEIGGGPGTRSAPQTTAASAPPALAARFLRELADDIEHAGTPGAAERAAT